MSTERHPNINAVNLVVSVVKAATKSLRNKDFSGEVLGDPRFEQICQEFVAKFECLVDDRVALATSGKAMNFGRSKPMPELEPKEEPRPCPICRYRG